MTHGIDWPFTIMRVYRDWEEPANRSGSSQIVTMGNWIVQFSLVQFCFPLCEDVFNHICNITRNSYCCHHETFRPDRLCSVKFTRWQHHVMSAWMTLHCCLAASKACSIGDMSVCLWMSVVKLFQIITPCTVFECGLSLRNSLILIFLLKNCRFMLIFLQSSFKQPRYLCQQASSVYHNHHEILIFLMQHCYDWHPGIQLTSKVDGGITGSRLRWSILT